MTKTALHQLVCLFHFFSFLILFYQQSSLIIHMVPISAMHRVNERLVSCPYEGPIIHIE